MSTDDLENEGDAIMLHIAYTLYEQGSYDEAENVLIYLAMQNNKEAINFLRHGQAENVFKKNLEDYTSLSRQKRKEVESNFQAKIFSLAKTYCKPLISSKNSKKHYIFQ